MTKLWEEQRYRRAGVALINGALLKAVEFYLEDICEAPFHAEHALDFFSTDPKEKKKVIADLAKHGITMAELQAKAAQIEREGLQLFDRMVAVRESGRRLLRKENERSTRRQNGGPDDTAKSRDGAHRWQAKNRSPPTAPMRRRAPTPNGGRTLKVQPQRAPARLVGAAAAGSGDFGPGHRHRAGPGRRRRQRGAAGVSCRIRRGAP